MPFVALLIWLVGGAIAGVLDKKATQAMPWQCVGLVTDILIVLTLPVYWYVYRDSLRWRDFNAPGVGWAVAGSLVGLVCWFAYYAALRGYEASKLGAYGLLDVAIGCVLCAIFLREPLTAAKAVGVTLMVAGVWVLGR